MKAINVLALGTSLHALWTPENIQPDRPCGRLAEAFVTPAESALLGRKSDHQNPEPSLTPVGPPSLEWEYRCGSEAVVSSLNNLGPGSFLSRNLLAFFRSSVTKLG